MLREPGVESSSSGSEPNNASAQGDQVQDELVITKSADPDTKDTQNETSTQEPKSMAVEQNLAQSRVEPSEEAREADVTAESKIDDCEKNIPVEVSDATVENTPVPSSFSVKNSTSIFEKIVDIVEFVPRPPMTHSDTKDSLSSVESLPMKEDNDNANHADLSDSASDDMNHKNDQVGGKNTSTEEEAEFIPPDDELAQKIIDQVEFYFSDVNITKDAFLLKHVKRNKEGYVSLKLISSFKRVKHLAKDWRVVAYALAKSKKLEINEAGTKLRRVDPLPAYDQTTPSRTVVAIELPLDKPTIENVAEMFKTCGEIALIRILRPGNPIPADVRHFVNKHPEMIGKISALVEFVRTESAHNAIQKEWNWRQEENMKVIELNAPPSVDKKKKTKKLMNRSFDMEHSSSCQSGSEAEDRRIRLQRRCSSPQLSHNDYWLQRRWSRDSGTDSSSSYSRSRSNSGVYYMPDHIRRMSTDSCSDSHSSRSRSNSGISLSDIRRLSIISKDSDCCCCHADCSRRGSFGKDSGSEGYGSSRSRCNSGASDIRRNSIEFYCSNKARERRYQDQGFWSSDKGRHQDHNKPRNTGENVVRMPRGPDGGRGFIPPVQPCHTLIE